MSDAETKHYLAVMTRGKRDIKRVSAAAEVRIKSFCELSAEEFQNIKTANDAVLLYRNQLLFLDFVQWNLEEYLALQERLLLQGDEIPTDAFRSPELELNRCLMNFLASVRAYLDHTETDLKRRFGPKSERYERFEQLTHKLYDSYFSYRFLYKFRNFAQHCGLPLDSVTHESSANSRALHVAVTRDRLLSHFDWGKLRPEIERLPEKVELTEFLCVHVQHITELHHRLCAEELPAVKKAAGVIVSTAARVRESKGDPLLLSMPSTPPSHVSPAGGRSVTWEQTPLFVELADFFVRDLLPNP